MKIQLDEHWRIEPDAYSWNLLYEKEGDINPNTGKPKLSRDVSYHGQLVDAVKRYLNETAKECKTANDIIEGWKDACFRVEKACQGVSKPKP